MNRLFNVSPAYSSGEEFAVWYIVEYAFNGV